MGNTAGMWMTGIACGLVLLIAAMRSRTQLLLNFILRAVLGLLMIYFVNVFLTSQGFPVQVGISAFSAAVTGLLGFPGVLLLYGIRICALVLG